MKQFDPWPYIILIFLTGFLGWLTLVGTLERQTEHLPSLTDQLAHQERP